MMGMILFLAVFFLLSSNSLTAMGAALQRMGRLQAEEELKRKSPFFFRHLLPFFFGKQKWEGLLFSLSFTKHILRIAFALTTFFFLLESSTFFTTSSHGVFLVEAGVFILLLSLSLDFFFNLLGKLKPRTLYGFFSYFASFLLLICIPITAPFFWLTKAVLSRSEKQKTDPTFRIRDKVEELLQETELGAYLDPVEKKLILSVVSFKERIAREVMVPRINLFALPIDIPLEDAAQSFLKERYSRIPVYKDTIDNIVGVFLYKDLLTFYIDAKSSHTLTQSIENFVKPVIYTPETKKISHLLQEFRNKQTHLAIVVDEWGGTEGIVTIEDILEELVGEIADEYDVGQPSLFTPLPGKGWIVDAQMSIVDAQEDLGIKIPFSPEYDTIGGYVFHRAGEIPSKGWRIHHEDFDLEVISSNERAVTKIKIIPHYTQTT